MMIKIKENVKAVGERKLQRNIPVHEKGKMDMKM
jgi:hypothetical protein